MSPKEYLSEYRNMLIVIRNLEAEAEEAESLAMSTTMSTDVERVQSSGRNDKMAELASKAADIRIEIISKRSEALDSLHSIGKTISSVKNRDYKQVLHMRYIERNTWEKIAVEMGVTYQWVHRLHGRALQDVEKIINNLQ